MERTLVLLKPDAVQRGLIGTIIARFEARGLQVAAMKTIQIDQATAEEHYDAHLGKPFFNGLVRFITSSPVVAIVLEGNRAIEVVRQTMGETDPAQAQPGTIRGDLALDIGRNLVHGSDSAASAKREVALFFGQADLLNYEKSLAPWVIES